jgi:AraC family transcriptional regulator
MLDPVPRTRADRVAATARAIALMSQDLSVPRQLDDLARAAMFSPFHFHRVFADVTGITPARFLTCLRIAESRRLLLHSTMSVAKISLTVGYASVGTFTTRFTTLVGESPAMFRRLALSVQQTVTRPPYVLTSVAGREDDRWRPWQGDADISGEIRFRALVLTPGRTVLDAVVDHDPDSYLLAEGRLRVTAGRPAMVTAVGLRRSLPTDVPILAAHPLRDVGSLSGFRTATIA